MAIYTVSKFGDEERISGITLSMLIPGEARTAHGAREAAAVISHQEIELKRWALIAEAISAVATVRRAYGSLQIANAGAAAMRENGALMQGAYQLGEAELQGLLQARRQANAASSSALQLHGAALKAYYGLLVDAHLIWDLEHE